MASSALPDPAAPVALVTRPRKEAEGLAAALAARGIAAVIEPLLQIHFRVPEELELDGVQAVLCTSGNGVRALARATGERGVTILAVGDATASRARAAGFTAVESAAGNVARSRPARERRGSTREHGRLLHVAGDVVAGDLVAALREAGFAVERRILYEARPASALSPAAVGALRDGEIDLALFFSPRTAAIFARLAGIARVAECCATITALSISPAADARARGPVVARPARRRSAQPAGLARHARSCSRRAAASRNRELSMSEPHSEATSRGGGSKPSRARGKRPAAIGTPLARGAAQPGRRRSCLAVLLALIVAGLALSPFWAPAMAPFFPWGETAVGLGGGACRSRRASGGDREAAGAADPGHRRDQIAAGRAVGPGRPVGERGSMHASPRSRSVRPRQASISTRSNRPTAPSRGGSTWPRRQPRKPNPRCSSSSSAWTGSKPGPPRGRRAKPPSCRTCSRSSRSSAPRLPTLQTACRRSRARRSRKMPASGRRRCKRCW